MLSIINRLELFHLVFFLFIYRATPRRGASGPKARSEGQGPQGRGEARLPGPSQERTALLQGPRTADRLEDGWVFIDSFHNFLLWLLLLP